MSGRDSKRGMNQPKRPSSAIPPPRPKTDMNAKKSAKPPKVDRQGSRMEELPGKLLNIDEDHIEGNDVIEEVLERKNQHKIKYLTMENQHLKSQLDDAYNTIE